VPIQPKPSVARPPLKAVPDAGDDPLACPTLPMDLFFKQYHGEAFTPEEEEVWAEYERGLAEYERRRSRLGLVDLAEVMREGATPPTMLVPGLIVEADHTVVYGPKEQAKTWLALWSAAFVMLAGGTVVWVDKEMGRKNLADRLVSMGVDIDLVADRFRYLEFPALDGSTESRALWEALFEYEEPKMVVVDAQTEVLADAGLNENSGTDHARWNGWYIEPARRRGVSTVVLDHTGHDEKGRPVGTRQKGASAKVELQVGIVKPFSRDALGSFKVTPTKNTVAADVPKVQFFEIGFDPERGFVFEPTMAALADDSELKWELEQADKIRAVLLAAPDLSKTALAEKVGGNKAKTLRLIARLADDPNSALTSAASGASVRYSWEES